MPTTAAKNSKLILAAMIFAVSMTFIDQTIVSIAVPVIEDDVDLSTTGGQWIVNGYMLALAVAFAFGGKLADIRGHKRMVLIGIGIFATASALCGAAPSGSAGEAWLIAFRIIQGFGAAIMFPAALAIVVSAYPQSERGRALAIFWINIPIAIAAVLLTLKAKPDNTQHPAPLDIRGLILFAFGIGLVVLGLQQSSVWHWDDARTIGTIVVGAALVVAFVRAELSTAYPLVQMRYFKNRAFAADNAILFLVSIAFVPMFLFASLYSQISLGDDASNAGLYIGTFFAGYVIAAQRGGAMLDKAGVKAPAALGCAIAAVGFYLWANQMPDMDYSNGGWWRIIIAGAGTGLMFAPVSTDALNRVPGTSYGEATGITQTMRNLGASLGLAVLGSLLVSQIRSNAEDKLTSLGCTKDVADGVADGLSSAIASGSSSGGGSDGLDGLCHGVSGTQILDQIPGIYANASETIFMVMAGVMVAAYVVAHFILPGGKAPEIAVVADGEAPAGAPTAPPA
jgi:predicted MFS family arabinose efflux permease